MDSKEPRKKRTLSWAWLLLLLLLLLFWWQSHLKTKSEEYRKQQKTADSLAVMQQKHMNDSLATLKRANMLDSLEQIRLDSLQKKLDSLKQNSLQKQKSLKKSKAILSSSSKQKLRTQQLDSIPPSGIVTPISGKYTEKVKVTFICDEPTCQTEYSVQDTSLVKSGTKLLIQENQTVWVRFVDSVGNKSSWKKESYSIEEKSNKCPQGMVHIQTGASYCIDEYEWPNRKGEFPITSISLIAAKKECEAIGKELCSLGQWQGACSIKKQKYPYGQSYQSKYCHTSGSRPKRVGFQSNCRSWEGVYDLSGNVWEWTNTPHKKRKNFVYVVGGNWASQDGATCSAAKYSFYPQNEYPMVGFRCCAKAKL